MKLLVTHQVISHSRFSSLGTACTCTPLLLSSVNLSSLDSLFSHPPIALPFLPFLNFLLAFGFHLHFVLIVSHVAPPLVYINHILTLPLASFPHGVFNAPWLSRRVFSFSFCLFTSMGSLQPTPCNRFFVNYYGRGSHIFCLALRCWSCYSRPHHRKRDSMSIISFPKPKKKN